MDALKLDKTNNNSGHLLLSGPCGGCDSLSLNLFCRMLLIGTDASVSGAVRSSCRSGIRWMKSGCFLLADLLTHPTALVLTG